MVQVHDIMTADEKRPDTAEPCSATLSRKGSHSFFSKLTPSTSYTKLPAIATTPPLGNSISIIYETGWEQPCIHFEVRGKWTTAPGLKMVRCRKVDEKEGVWWWQFDIRV